jgi:hypothetical protein
MAKPKQVGYNFEVYAEQRLHNLGFINLERQPLSGAYRQLDRKSDIVGSIILSDGFRADFMIECKRTMKKQQIIIKSEWLSKNEELAESNNRISILLFALGGKPGQKLIVYSIIRKSDFISLSGNMEMLSLKKLKRRGNKQQTIRRNMLDESKRRVGLKNAPDGMYFGAMTFINNSEYIILEIDELVACLLSCSEKNKPDERWF